MVDRDTQAQPRYRMLETVRQYAEERLNERGEGEATRARHVAHFVAMGEEAEPHVRGPDQDAWMSRFKQEHENLIAALTWCSGSARSATWPAPSGGDHLLLELEQRRAGHRLTIAVREHDRAAIDTPARRYPA